MFDAAFASIAQAFSAAYGGPFYSGFVNHPGTPIFDNGGSIATPGVATSRPCQVQADAVTDAMRRDANYQDKDIRLFVLCASLEGVLDTDCTVRISDGPHAGEWMVATVNRDPVAVGWECLGRKL